MKKIFTLLLALFAMVAIQAQNLLYEDFENGIPTTWLNIDADNDSYAWMEGTAPGVSGHDGSNGCAYSCSWYNNTALTPNNWLITPAVNLTGNATLTFWVAAQDASYPAEHYGVYISTTAGTTPADFTLLFEETIDANGGARVQGTWKQKTVDLSSYTGQTVRIAFRHFNCTDMFYIDLDDVVIFAQPTGPTISVAPTSINFGSTMVGGNTNATVDITTYNLTAPVVATTTAPFSVSADGTTFGTTANVAATGGTLYVRYTPAAVGTDNGSVTLASTGATDQTITLAGTGIECTTTLPYSYSFSDNGLNQCWTIVDANNDGKTFMFYPEDSLAQYTYHSTNPADDWLISPVFNLTGSQFCNFSYYGSTSFPEKFQVFAIDANNVNTPLTGIIDANTGTWELQLIDLTSLTGSYQIGIHCVSNADELYLRIKNFNINDNAPTASMDVNPTGLDFGIIPTGSVSNLGMAVVHTVNMNEAITLATAAPFEISLNGTTFAATQTIPANADLVVYDTVYVRFAPTATGTFSQNLTVTATSLNGTVALTGEAIECTTITTFPFTETFDEDSPTRPCWTIVDANNDNYTIEYLPYDDYNTGVAVYFYNSDNNADDWLISPEMTLPAGATFLSYDYAIAQPSLPEKYSVWVIPENGTYATATNILPTQTVNTSGILNNILDLSNFANQTVKIAFKVESDTDMYYIYFDNVSVMAAGEASLTVDPASMIFTGFVGTPTASEAAHVLGLALSNDIAITATAPFEVSTNGTSYASSATIPQATIVNTIIYVRMNSTSAGVQNGTVTLTSGTATATINITGNAVDCSLPQALPFNENFDFGMPLCWTILDEDGDGISWEPSTDPASYFDPSVDLSGTGHDGSMGFVLSGSFTNVTGEALYPDNWLITPALAIPSEGAKLSFYVAAQDADYANEHYGVYVSTTGTDPNNFTLLYEEDLDEDGGPRAGGAWKQKNVNLPYSGQTIYLAIRHFNCSDMFLIDVDDFSVTAGVGIVNHGVKTVIFPNPANNVLNINATENINRVEVYNMMGQLVGTYNANDVNTQINTSRFANGVYTVKIETENGTSTQKFTVAR